MYFEKFPVIGYAYKIQGKNKLFLLKDIALNVRVRKEIIQNVALYDYYDIQEGETPDIIAHKFYGDSNLHWVIMLLNERFNYLEDFPMTSAQLSAFITQKYGTGNEYAQHQIFGKAHYESLDNLVVDSTYSLATVVSNYDYEFRVNESKRKIKLIAPSLISKVVTELTEAFSEADFE